jgi:F0F1-type ATP synthase assembly protein I
MAVAMMWVQQITTVSLEMVLPAGLGYWLDQKWGTSPWMILVGAVFGMVAGMWHLLHMVGATKSDKGSKGGPPDRS